MGLCTSATLHYEGPDSPKGKEWQIDALMDGSLRIEYGATGSRRRTTLVPPSRFQAGNAHKELLRRLNLKQDEGYRIVSVQKTDETFMAPESYTDIKPQRQELAASSETLGTWFF